MMIFASSSECDFEGGCADDADLDGRFAIRTIEGERFWLNGWLFHIEVLSDDPAAPGA